MLEARVTGPGGMQCPCRGVRNGAAAAPLEEAAAAICATSHAWRHWLPGVRIRLRSETAPAVFWLLPAIWYVSWSESP